MPWYAEEKARSGAFAAVAGLVLRSSTTGVIQWRGMAVGDSCLLHLRAGRLLSSFPIADPDEFGRAPRLVSTEPTANRGVRLTGRSGTLRPGDRLVLVTDALALTLLSMSAADVSETVDALEDRFIETIGRLRTQGDLRNDDVTMVSVTCE